MQDMNSLRDVMFADYGQQSMMSDKSTLLQFSKHSGSITGKPTGSTISHITKKIDDSGDLSLDNMIKNFPKGVKRAYMKQVKKFPSLNL